MLHEQLDELAKFVEDAGGGHHRPLQQQPHQQQLSNKDFLTDFDAFINSAIKSSTSHQHQHRDGDSSLTNVVVDSSVSPHDHYSIVIDNSSSNSDHSSASCGSGCDNSSCCGSSGVSSSAQRNYAKSLNSSVNSTNSNSTSAVATKSTSVTSTASASSGIYAASNSTSVSECASCSNSLGEQHYCCDKRYHHQDGGGKASKSFSLSSSSSSLNSSSNCSCGKRRDSLNHEFNETFKILDSAEKKIIRKHTQDKQTKKENRSATQQYQASAFSSVPPKKLPANPAKPTLTATTAKTFKPSQGATTAKKPMTISSSSHARPSPIPVKSNPKPIHVLTATNTVNNAKSFLPTKTTSPSVNTSRPLSATYNRVNMLKSTEIKSVSASATPTKQVSVNGQSPRLTRPHDQVTDQTALRKKSQAKAAGRRDSVKSENETPLDKQPGGTKSKRSERAMPLSTKPNGLIQVDTTRPRSSNAEKENGNHQHQIASLTLAGDDTDLDVSEICLTTNNNSPSSVSTNDHSLTRVPLGANSLTTISPLTNNKMAMQMNTGHKSQHQRLVVNRSNVQTRSSNHHENIENNPNYDHDVKRFYKTPPSTPSAVKCKSSKAESTQAVIKTKRSRNRSQKTTRQDKSCCTNIIMPVEMTTSHHQAHQHFGYHGYHHPAKASHQSKMMADASPQTDLAKQHLSDLLIEFLLYLIKTRSVAFSPSSHLNIADGQHYAAMVSELLKRIDREETVVGRGVGDQAFRSFDYRGPETLIKPIPTKPSCNGGYHGDGAYLHQPFSVYSSSSPYESQTSSKSPLANEEKAEQDFFANHNHGQSSLFYSTHQWHSLPTSPTRSEHKLGCSFQKTEGDQNEMFVDVVQQSGGDTMRTKSHSAPFGGNTDQLLQSYLYLNNQTARHHQTSSKSSALLCSMSPPSASSSSSSCGDSHSQHSEELFLRNQELDNSIQAGGDTSENSKRPTKSRAKCCCRHQYRHHHHRNHHYIRRHRNHHHKKHKKHHLKLLQKQKSETYVEIPNHIEDPCLFIDTLYHQLLASSNKPMAFGASVSLSSSCSSTSSSSEDSPAGQETGAVDYQNQCNYKEQHLNKVYFDDYIATYDDDPTTAEIAGAVFDDEDDGDSQMDSLADSYSMGSVSSKLILTSTLMNTLPRQDLFDWNYDEDDVSMGSKLAISSSNTQMLMMTAKPENELKEENDEIREAAETTTETTSADAAEEENIIKLFQYTIEQQSSVNMSMSEFGDYEPFAVDSCCMFTVVHEKALLPVVESGRQVVSAPQPARLLMPSPSSILFSTLNGLCEPYMSTLNLTSRSLQAINRSLQRSTTNPAIATATAAISNVPSRYQTSSVLPLNYSKRKRPGNNYMQLMFDSFMRSIKFLFIGKNVLLLPLVLFILNMKIFDQQSSPLPNSLLTNMATSTTSVMAGMISNRIHASGQ